MPYEGQGHPVPSTLGRGDWIVEGLAFLSLDDPDTTPPGPAGLMVGVGSAGIDPVSFGVDRVAAQMGLSRGDVLRANREGRLRIANRQVETRTPGARAMRFRLTIEDRFFEITEEREPL